MGMGETLIGDMPCYVLTLDATGGRRRSNAVCELQRLGLQARFIEGIAKNRVEIWQEYSVLRNLLLHKRSLTAGEVSTYCGHRRIWREFLTTSAPCALVFEDDFSIKDPHRFRSILADSVGSLAFSNLVKFFDYRAKTVRESQIVGGTRFVRGKYAAAGAVAYLIRRDAAEALLSRQKFFRPVDEDFSWPWEMGLAVWSVDPNPVAEISSRLGGSLLETERRENRYRKSILRSLWGNVLHLYKQARAGVYEGHHIFPTAATIPVTVATPSPQASVSFEQFREKWKHLSPYSVKTSR